MTGVLLVHSPLVGPSSLRPLATVASNRGLDISMPDLTGAMTSADPHRAYVEMAADACATTSPDVIVGHSGAGAFVPLIAGQTGVRLVFLDAVLPPANGPYVVSDQFRTFIAENRDGSRLRPWLDWWPDEVVERLVPERVDREALRADTPRLPADFYDDAIQLPTDWDDGSAAYLRLSSAYDEEYAEAQSRGWRVIHLDSTHLATVTEPERVLNAIVQLIRR